MVAARGVALAFLAAFFRVADTFGEVELSPALFLSSKTPYYPQQHYSTYESVPAHCRLVHVNHLGRHGSRHSTKLKSSLHLYDALTEALRLGHLKPRGVVLLQSVARFVEGERDRLGVLTEDGRREHEETAYRQWAHLGEDLRGAFASGRRFVFEATHKSRAVGSRDAFIRGFSNAARAALRNTTLSAAETLSHEDSLEHARRLLLSTTQSLSGRADDALVVVQPPFCSAPVRPSSPSSSDDDVLWEGAAAAQSPKRKEKEKEKDKDKGRRKVTLAAAAAAAAAPVYSPTPLEAHHYAKLRFFDTCSTYLKYKKNKSWAAELAPYTANATLPGSSENALLSQIFEPGHLELLAAQDAAKRDKRKHKADDAGASWPSPPPPREKKGKGDGHDKRRGFLVTAKTPKGPRSKHAPTAELVRDLYSVCQIQANAYHELDEACRTFERHLNVMAKYELLSDLADYYKQGAGDVAAGMSCLLVEDFLDAGDEGAGVKWVPEEDGMGPDPARDVQRRAPGGPASAAVRSLRRGPTTAFAHYRFGHSETVMPFLSILGLYQEPGAPSLHDYYKSMLARGTRHLLNETRARALEIAASHVAYTWEPPGAEEEAVQLQLAQLIGDAKGSSSSSPSAMRHRLSRHATALGISTGTPSRWLPFETPTMLALKHPWSGARLIPMAANVQWLLYDCGDAPVGASDAAAPASAAAEMRGLWVKMLHNEREVQFPPCQHHHAPHADAAQRAARGESNTYASRFGLHYPCPWEVVKDYFRSVVYPAHGIQTCDAEDWVRLCGGVGQCEADSGD